LLYAKDASSKSFTVKVNVSVLPTQLAVLGVTIMFPTSAPPLVAPANEAMFPEPLAARPISTLSFVQSKVVPVPVKFTAVKFEPTQTVSSAIGSTVGSGSIVTDTVEEAKQIPAVVYVTSYVPGVEVPGVI